MGAGARRGGEMNQLLDCRSGTATPDSHHATTSASPGCLNLSFCRGQGDGKQAPASDEECERAPQEEPVGLGQVGAARAEHVGLLALWAEEVGNGEALWSRLSAGSRPPRGCRLEGIRRDPVCGATAEYFVVMAG